jgi:hypothetical protein
MCRALSRALYTWMMRPMTIGNAGFEEVEPPAMRLYVACPECLKRHMEQLQDAKYNPDSEQKPLRHYPRDIPDDGIVELICEEGHETAVLLYANRHGLLFDSGASALADGYPREAVASFAASVERFYEHMAKAILLANGVERPAILALWKTVKRQSERQLGMFRALYVQDTKEVAPDLEKLVEFRNSVIHQGQFPTPKEAVEYGQSCLDHMRQILDTVHIKHADALNSVAEWEAEELRKRAPQKSRLTVIRDSIIEKGINQPRDRQSLSEWLLDTEKDNYARDRYRAWKIVQQIQKEQRR